MKERKKVPAGTAEHKLLTAKIISELDADGTFEAVVAVTGELDYDDDIIEPGSLLNSGVKMFLNAWGHNYREEPYGTLTLREENEQFIAKGQLMLDLPQGARMRTIMQHAGDVLEFSIGYRAVKRFYEELDEYPYVVRHIQEIEIYEVSPVTKGAQPGSRLIGVKSMSDLTAKEIKLIERFRAMQEEEDDMPNEHKAHDRFYRP